jgi:hypothetical protein
MTDMPTSTRSATRSIGGRRTSRLSSTRNRAASCGCGAVHGENSEGATIDDDIAGPSAEQRGA